MIFNHSLRIVKKLNSGNLSGLRLSKLSAQCHAQRCIIYASSPSIYEDVIKSLEEFERETSAEIIRSRKIGKSMEITGTVYTDFFGFLACLNFADEKILDMVDCMNTYVLSDSLRAKAEEAGFAADPEEVEKLKDTIVLYVKIRNLEDDYVPSEEELFELFEEVSGKYDLGIVYDGMEEIA